MTTCLEWGTSVGSGITVERARKGVQSSGVKRFISDREEECSGKPANNGKPLPSQKTLQAESPAPSDLPYTESKSVRRFCSRK
ncbi:hypothetical protein ZHAS_00007014 [Anopheles sinensis]|uniref:Uncharacterized protein n=1 Tax=Anopheles sinensis TaxID=74873 RepID=A0A084VNN4_ANOSI|nr:hypothetical protein ZHAS_00007014 [Anopheles sinensis]